MLKILTAPKRATEVKSELPGETVLITGASSGIGRATAIYLAERGYRVIGTSRSLSRLSGLRELAAQRKLPIAAVELDPNRDEDVFQVVPALIEELGPVDALVNNAGYGLWGPVEAVSMEELKAQFEVNFFGAVRLIKAVLPCMVRQRRGTIVNVSSIAGRIGTPFNAAYSASKFALEGLSESLRAELASFGVRVVLVEPGLFKTDFYSNRAIAKRALSPDGPYFQRIERYWQKHRGYEKWAADPIKVAKVVHKIIRSPDLAFRYPVGLEAHLGILGRRLLPERIFNALLDRAI